MTNGVTMVAGATIRRQWRSIVVIALLVGVGGAVVLASVAGARRTSSALDRFEAYSRNAQLEITAGTPTAAQLRRFRHAPGVVAVAELHQLTLTLPDGSFPPVAAAVDQRFGTIVDRARVIEGRLPRASKPLELAVGETFAARMHLHVGDIATFLSFSVAQVERAIQTNGDPGPPAGPVLHFRVVGIVRRPLDLGVRGGPGGVIVPTPGFLHRYRSKIGSFSGTILRVRTGVGRADVARVGATARRIFGKDPLFQTQGLGVETQGASDAIDVLAIAIWLFAGIALVAGLVAVGIVESRQIGSEDRDQSVLSSLGLTLGQRATAAGALSLPVAIGGTVIALVGAALLSPLLPFGVARKADFDAGFHIDALVFAIGGLAIFMTVLLIGATAGRQVALIRGGRAIARPSTVARAAEGAGVTPPVAAGLRMALEPGHGRSAVPVRSAFLGAAFGVVGIVAALVFSASLDHLVASPRLYGWSFDAVVLPPAGQAPPGDEAAASRRCDTTFRSIVRDAQFSAVAVWCTAALEVDGRATQGWALRSLRGSIQASLVRGRDPRGSQEIALGAVTLSALGKHIGDSVRVRENGGTKRFRIVGEVSFPSPATIDAQPLADGAALAPAGMVRVVGSQSELLNTNYVARFAAGVDPRKLPIRPNGVAKIHVGSAVLPNVPVEIARLQQIDDLPTILGGLLALLAAAAVGHSIVLAISRRRGDLAILRTLGFRRGQVRTAVVSQSMTYAVLGLLVGIPLGIAAGRLLWRATADNLGVAAHIAVPAFAMLAVVVGAVLITNVIGLLGARAGIRTKPGEVLRTE